MNENGQTNERTKIKIETLAMCIRKFMLMFVFKIVRPVQETNEYISLTYVSMEDIC